MSLINGLVSCVLVLIMFGIGVSLSLRDISTVFSKPKGLIIALCSQMILLPLLAYGIDFAFPSLPSYIKIGLVILAASPGGSTSGFITYIFKGNIALSIILTSINSLLTLFTIPLIINHSLQLFNGSGMNISLPFWDTLKEICLLTLLPATAGVVVRYFSINLAVRISRTAKPVLMILLAIAFVLKFFGGGGEEGVTREEIVAILPYALLLNVLCFTIGYLISKSFKLGRASILTVAVESSVHNTTLAFLISGNLMHYPQFGKVALIYALFSFWTALLFCIIINKLEGGPSVRQLMKK